MSFSTLNIGASALYVTQRQVEVASHNVANVNTPGYTRQRLDVTASPPQPGTPGMRGDGMRGTGVTVLSIGRMRDQLADIAYRSEADAAGFASARATVLDRTVGVLGPYAEGVPASLDRFWASFDQLSLNPSNPAARAGVLSAGDELAGLIRTSSTAIDQVTSDTKSKITDDVAQINDLAATVAKLNQQIEDATVNGSSPNDLLDQRDNAIDQLSKLAGVTVQHGQAGMVNINVGTNVLVSGVFAQTLQVAQTSGVTSVTFSDGSRAAMGGEVGGYLQTVNVDLPGFAAQLDDVANVLMTTVNAVHQQGYSLADPTATSPNGGDFFTGTGARDIAVRSGLTANDIAAGSTNSPNDGNNALALAQLRAKAVVGPATITDQLHALATGLGAAAAAADRRNLSTSSALTAAETVRTQQNSVSSDEELVDLVKFQHAYSAAARVISTADGMLDTLINHMGAGR